MENKWQTKNGFNAQGITLETSIQSIDSLSTKLTVPWCNMNSKIDFR